MASTDNFEELLITLLVAAVLALLVSRTLSGTANAKGRQGETEVSAGLSRVLDDTKYYLIDNITLPFGNSTTQIDHLIVSQYGVFVVETKNMSGWIFGGETQANWTQVIYRVKHKFQNPVRQNFKHVKAVQRLCKLAPNQVHSVVIFVGDCTFKTNMPDEVVQGVSGLVSYIESKRVGVIAEENVTRHIDLIQSAKMAPDRKTERDHVRNVRSAINVSSGDENVACPRCGNSMVERTNKRTGERFFGCVRFPTCRGVRRLTEN